MADESALPRLSKPRLHLLVLAAVGLGLGAITFVVFAATPEAILPPLRALRLGVRVRAYGEGFWLERARSSSPTWLEALAYCGRHSHSPNCAAVLDARWIYDLQRSLSERKEPAP